MKHIPKMRSGKKQQLPAKLYAHCSRPVIRLALMDRPEDLRVRPFATGGFFQFWERLRKTLVANSTGNGFAEQQTLIELRP